MNAIKAKMHNRVLLNLLKKHPEAHMYMDQFAEPGLYFSYLKNENEVAKKICFSTKGESQFPSVALGSVIARYAFLRKMDAMGKRFGVVFPKGAGVEVDSFAKDFLASHDEETLERVAKKNFANWKKLF
jgi:ribonuclease HIII